MALRFQLFTLFCVIVFNVNAEYIDQPQLYVADNNLHFQMPPESYIKFAASKIKVNDVDLLKTLEGAQNVSKLLPSYKMFISQFHSKMDDMENRLVNIRYDPENNSTNVTAALAQLSARITGFNSRIFVLRRTLRGLQQLLTRDECASNPCKNGGSCFDLFNGFLCQCQNGWEGPTCQSDINECARFVGTDLGCQNGGTCLNLPGTYQCQCPNGWIGLHCNRKPSDCNSGGSEICGHGTCIPQNNEAGFKCLCDQGWTNDGTHKACTEDVDECKQNHPPCSTNPLVQCINLPGSFMCQHCPFGYTGNGYYCSDINECELFNGGCSVSPYVECLNSPGSSKCGPCPAGYEGDGKICTFKGVCNINNGGCSFLARCFPNPAIAETYVQCVCPEGYTGNGIGPTGCTKTSSSTATGCSPNPCVHGTCASIKTSPWFTCTCNRGFSGTYCDQRDDPCATNPCLNGGTCVQRRRRFTCSCLNGFTGRFCQLERQACGENINLPNGTISYPSTDFDSSRGTENLGCAWTIKTQEDKVIEVNFTKFNFADAPCTSQWFQVHDGRNSLAPGLGRFCGKTLPFNGSLTTTHNVIYFWLKTNGQSGKKPEFEMSWSTKDAACGGRLSPNGMGMIVSPGWPNNYPNNRECSWRFFVPVDKRLLFHVYSLNIGQNSGCTEDYLEFYSHQVQVVPSTTIEIVARQLFAKLCNSTIPSPFYSLSNSGYIRFKSNEKDAYTGFQIGYSVVDGIPGCGGTYTNKDGYIQSIEVTSSMPFPLICVYEIKLNVNTTVKLEIVEIDLEQICDDTNIAIYLESATGTSLISKYCGNKISGPFETYGSKILIKSLSRYGSKNHWKIRYEAVCHQLYTKPIDTIAIDPSWKECRYLIEQPPGNIILLDIQFSSTTLSFFRGPTLQVWDGDTENSTYIGQYPKISGRKIRIESTTNYLLIKSKPGRPYDLSPYVVTYTTLDLGCGGLLKNDLGTIAYPPRGIEKYSANGKCRWVIMAPPGKVVQLTWMTFNLEQSFDCSYDNLQVFDNNTDIGMGGLLGKYCGYTLPPVMLSSSNIMTLNFVSDNTIHGDGFLVSYTFIRENNVCGGNYFTPAGVIKSPGYPQSYPTNRECIWTITVQPGSQIMLKMSNFSLENYSSCRYDWLEIRNGGSSSSPLIGKYCGTTYPKTIPSHTNKIYIKFNSDMSRTGRGFKIDWSSAATGCGGTLTSPSGSIMSPHYPEPYTKNTECLWKITVSAGSKIQLIFADIDLEKHSACGLDYVQLFDGPTINSNSLGKFCSTQANPVVSTKNTLLVRFRSDVSFQGRGFNIQYTTICTNKMMGFRGVIESPNFPNDYPQDQDCVWDIAVYLGNKINISFSHFALERSTTLGNNSCTFDYVEIEYGSGNPYGDIDSEPEWQKYDRYCGDRNPGFITLNTNLAKIHFVSDSLLLGTGFRLEWQLFGCGGILTNGSGTIQSPNYPNPYSPNLECNWAISVPLGQSISIQFDEIDVEKDLSCAYDFIEIFNGKDDTYQQIAKFCHQIKPITVTSTGNNMFVKFKADLSYEGRGFKASYKTSHTNCGGLLTAPKGYIFSPNYPKNFNKDETCEWLIDIDEHHAIELKFEDVDLIKGYSCVTNYIKVYDGPTQAYPLLETICGTTKTPNKTIRSTYEHMFIEFRSDSHLTSKGFKAQYSKACGATIKTSGSGQIQFRRELDLLSQSSGDETSANCSYTIESEDKSKHVTLTIAKLDSGMTWCDDESPALKIYNGPFNDSPLIGDYCESKIPPPITSDGSALHIEIRKEIDFFATYSVLDNHCGGDLLSQDGFMATPGWPKSYPIEAECAWTIAMGPGNTISFNFINFDIPESENCNTDFLEIRETNATGNLLGVFCGTNAPTNISAIGPAYLIFKSSRLEEGVVASEKGFYAEYATSSENTLSGSEGFIGNQHYPNPFPSGTYGSHTWLITTNSSTIIELSFIEFYIESNGLNAECYGNVMKVYDGMDMDAPLLKELCSASPPGPILSTSNMMYITIDYYTSRTETKFLLKWKELPKKSGVTPTTTSNTTGSGCQYSYTIEGQSNVTLTSPGYPTEYASNLHCEWIYETVPQYHLKIRFTDMNFGTWGNYRVCTYADVVRIYTKRDTTWELLKEMCNNTKSIEEVQGSNLMKVEFQSNKYNNGLGFQAKVFAVCGGTLTAPSGVIALDKAHAFNTQCQWNITVRAGRTIKLTFYRFDLSPNDPNNCRNYLIIRNGKFPDSPFLGNGKFCGSDTPPDLESTSNHIYLKYTGTSSNVEGFKIKYSEVSIDCGQDIRLSPDETSAEITSPNYPNIPQVHSECIWTIRAPPGEALRVDFEERFDISQYSRCTTDYVELRDGGTELSPLIGRYCYETPSTQFSTDNMLRIKYFTDSNEPRNGFKANISISYCGGTLHGEGTISTKEPQVIRAGSNCTWYLKAPLDYYIVIRFLKFQVAQRSINCNSEDSGKVNIYETSSISGNDVSLGTFCGRINTTEITSSTNEVRVNYLAKSDHDEFRLNFTIVKEECGGTYVQETGTILSPGYPLMNHENRYCFWKIKVPKGRRISLFVEDLDLDTTSTMLLIFHGYTDGPKLVGLADIHAQQTYETSDNGAHMLYWQEFPSSKRGFKIKFTSDKPSICDGDFNTTSGQLQSPERSASYRCEYTHSQTVAEETLAINIVMETNATNIGLNQGCSKPSTGIRIYSETLHLEYYLICKSTNNRPYIFRSTFPIITLAARQNFNTSLNYTISFKTYPCGGLLEGDEGNISSPNFPSAPQDSFECSWRFKMQSPSSRIKINFTTLDLGDDCDKSYVLIYNGWTTFHPKLGKYCQNNKPELIISQRNHLLIEYRFEKGGNNQSKGFNLKYEPEIHGCGGIYHSKDAIIETPNYGKQYGNNQECIWDIRAQDGNMIRLTFSDRFYIEDSENCTKDYVEIFDWKDERWVSLGKRCGRNLPEQFISSNNQLRIIFRSNDKITGTGFHASWDWHCGGVLEAAKEDRYLMSPGYPNTYRSHFSTNCTYKIVSKKGLGIVRLTFLDFSLGTGIRANCAYSNLTITGTLSGRLPNSMSQMFCGNDVPMNVQRYRGAVVITFMRNYHYFGWSTGFKLVYRDETCGGNITSPAALESPIVDMTQASGIMKFYQARVPCAWYITAPPGQLPVFSVHKLNATLASHCSIQSLEVYDGLEPKLSKRLAQLCGTIEESKPIPSTSNTMLIKLDSTHFNNIGFKGEIYFTYGPSVGCGGTINLTETKYLNAPNNLPHMDCHWTVVAPRDHKVEIKFTDISISSSCENPVRNHTYYCTCSYVEVRDGGGSFADQMVKLCSHDNRSTRNLTTSWNTAYIRLYSAVPQNNIMFRLTLTPIQSKCGPSLLTASKQFQELTSPDYPNSYHEAIKCTWVIKSPTNMGRFMISFEELDFPADSSSSMCTSDRLELTEDPNQSIIREGFGPTARHQVQTTFGASREAFKYAFCDKTKPFDYYSAGSEVTLTFLRVEDMRSKGIGFKLKYGSAGCNRTIYANEGRIQNDVSNLDESSNCIITIVAAPNRTISIYFMTFYFITPDGACSTFGLEIRENNSTGPELFKACGFRLPKAVFSNSNQLYIRTYNLQGRPSTYFKYNFMYVSSDKGKGCGGKLFNYMGKFSSPMYPNPYRFNIECTWDIMVPKGYKVALKLTDFNIGGGCTKNKLVITTNSEGDETDHTFCPDNNPALMFSDHSLRVTYYSSVNNGGNGWLAVFQAIKEESNNILWF